MDYITKAQLNMLDKIYYKEGYTLGRTSLFNVLKDKYKNPPSERQVGEWLREQKIDQLYKPTRKSGGVSVFKPTLPFNSLSADLIDFTNKPARQYRYILVVIDNFSRFMYTQPMTSKTAKTTSKAMEKILDKIVEDHDKVPRYILGDDGSEFKGDYIELLKSRGIEKRRTLGGQPQSNGLVERANGKLKRVMAKNKEIFKGTWVDNLPRATKIYNDYVNRSIGYTPLAASALKGVDAQTLRDNVMRTQKDEHREKPADYKLDDSVRIKIAKGSLDKSTTHNWSSTIYKIRKVIKGRPPKATRYLIKGKQDDQQYSRNDLQLIEGVPQEIPEVTQAQTRQQTKGVNKAKTGQALDDEEARPKTRLVSGLGKGGHK